MVLKKIKEKKVDDEFSLYIRERDNWTCQIQYQKECRGRVDPPTRLIQASHWYSRVWRAVRFDERNVDAFCDKCHSALERDKQGYYRQWKISRLGILVVEELDRIHRDTMQFRQPDYREMIAEFRRKKELVLLDRDGYIFGKH